jgi:hypothetical protein
MRTLLKSKDITGTKTIGTGCTYKDAVESLRDDKWVEFEFTDERSNSKTTLRFKRGDVWRSQDIDCYVGGNESFRAPSCKLARPGPSGKPEDLRLYTDYTVDAYSISE